MFMKNTLKNSKCFWFLRLIKIIWNLMFICDTIYISNHVYIYKDKVYVYFIFYRDLYKLHM